LRHIEDLKEELRNPDDAFGGEPTGNNEVLSQQREDGDHVCGTSRSQGGTSDPDDSFEETYAGTTSSFAAAGRRDSAVAHIEASRKSFGHGCHLWRDMLAFYLP
jgi:hypothetical protein